MNLFIHSIPNWMELISLACSTGILVSLLWILPAKASDGLHGHGDIRSRMWLVLAICVFTTLATSCADLVTRSAEMSGTPLPEVFPVLPTVVFRTHYGAVWRTRMSVLILLVILLPLGRRYGQSRGFLLFLLALAAAVSMTESASGHAADAGDFSMVELADWLHLLAASVWAGGLFALSLTILPALVKTGDHESPLLADAASRFSRIAGLAVPIMVLSALSNAWTYVGSMDALVKSSYGWTIIAKIALLVMLLGMGALNRYVRVPAMRKAALLPEAGPGIIGRFLGPVLATRVRNPEGQSARAFARSVRAESVLMIAMLLCAALLRHEIPAKHYLHQQGGHHQHRHFESAPR